MKALIAVASKHGSSREIAEGIAGELGRFDIETEIADVGDGTADDLNRADAIVLGSAVYMGRLMPEMRTFVEVHRSVLGRKPVWAFASGPIGDPPKPDGDSPDLTKLAAEIGARGARTFAGRLDPADLGFKERLVVKAVHAKPGDFRNWEEIRTWAGEIAASLRPSASA